MKLFERILQKHSDFETLVTDVRRGDTPLCVTGLSGIHKAHFAFGLHTELGKKLLFIVPDEAAGYKVCEDINTMLGYEGAFLYPVKDLIFRDMEGASREYEHRRVSVLAKMQRGQCDVVVTTAQAASQFTLPPEALREDTLVLHPGESYQVEELVKVLVEGGYVRRDFVDGICQFSLRGGILDIYPAHLEGPIRIEFWGDEIDTISYFDLATQRRIDTVKEITIIPATEVLIHDREALAKKLEDLAKKAKGPQKDAVQRKLQNDAARLRDEVELGSLDKYIALAYPKPATLFDYAEDYLCCISELADVKEKAKGANWQQEEEIKLLFEEGLICKGIDTFQIEYSQFTEEVLLRGPVLFSTFARTIPDIRVKKLIDVSAVSLSPWSGETHILKDDLRDVMERRYACVIFAGNEKAAYNLASELQKAGFDASYSEDVREIALGKLFVLPHTLTSGFEYRDVRFCLITHAKVLATKKRRAKIKGKDYADIGSLSDLQKGDYVVHVTHGIGLFDGIHKLDMHGVVKDYIKVKYAGADVLYVPVTQLDLVSKYVGPRENGNVKLSKLNSQGFANTKRRVKQAVDNMADELIALYSQRLEAPGHAFVEDDEMQRDFESRFAYEETDDQLRCIDEIKHDMCAPHPMDRLLCGDVGFGKTEVALRAAFKCVLDGKQCALLVPTTILAWQHYQTMIKRMEDFPVQVDLLSRFRSPKEQKQTIAGIKSGRVDIVVGTHRLLQNDIRFKDLGLVIIDEEQRFGVAHKEKLKEAFKSVDVLTLSATPIPRTLNMAMSGIRDMSVIEEAPMDRFPVTTYVTEYDEALVFDVLSRELRRGGQAFYLHNNTETIERCAAKLKGMLPDARIEVAHGKMDEGRISETWRRLIDHEIDILVCTTIIETGVDVPNCNTLIVEDADRLGLSQLYQLRGRVGRSSRRAFAYFTFNRGKVLTEISSKRLSAMREFTKFGSGFRIAMRDLEIRGCGNILGGKQHGHMEAVGYDMYMKLLNQAISEKKGETPPLLDNECLVDIRMDAYIPGSYIDSTAGRIEVYRRIASITSEEESHDVIDELIDRFGDMPSAVQGLIDVALVRNTANKLGIYEISQQGDDIRFYLNAMDMKQISGLIEASGGRVMVNASAKPFLSVTLQKGEAPLALIRQIFGQMSITD